MSRPRLGAPRSEAVSEILIATGSADKLREIRGILAGAPFRLLGLEDLGSIDEPDEPHETFLANAVHKANHYARITGLSSLADDSGLCVDALGGEPGVRSRRFAGAVADGPGASPERAAQDRRNNELLLERLHAVPAAHRAAHYVCVAACVHPDVRRAPVIGVGTVSGRIANAPRGAGGFGYDPLFVLPHDGRTFGQMSASEKHVVSHRGRAFRAIAAGIGEG